MSVSIREVKAAASGQWTSRLVDAGMPAHCLEPGGHPCPRCGDVDRFGIAKDSRINRYGYGIWLHQKSN
jgi:phage/plasmid primase-like uncharacterized protein